jgi:hypothetical protein
VRNRGEVVAQIRIDDLPLSALRDVPKHLAYGHLGIQFRPEAILVSQHVRLEDGADHQHHRHLDHAVADGRNAERSLPAVALWNPHSQQGLRAVGGAVQLLHDPFQPLLSTPSLDLVERDAIDARRTAVRTAVSIGFFDDVRPTDFVPERIEAESWFSLSFCL